jgi:tetratricopeptide (TPR) repeat protein
MLHSFWYSEGLQTFRSVLQRDPQCVTAYWGIASLLMDNPLAGVGAAPKGAEEAIAAIEQGRQSRRATQRERDYLEAVAAYYKDFGERSESARQRSRSDAYVAVAERYPRDDEAQIFNALYLAGTQSQADQTYASYLRAAAALETQFRRHPDHPGVAHYLIHSYDAPPIAGKGIDAARRYASIAPAAPHALHMPSHIFTRVGAWSDSASTNQRSFTTAKADKDGDGAFHAADYMVYAYLQQGKDAQAQAALDAALAVKDTINTARQTAFYADAAMHARMALERSDWKAAAALKPQKTRFPFVDAITHFSRAVGAARSGDVVLAEQESEQLAQLHQALLDAKNAYWGREVEVQRLATAGWIAHAKGDGDEALKFMRAAADLEDKNEKHIVTPGRVLPAREMLGDMLMAMKMPVEALQSYETSQSREPNRFRGYAGAARAAAAAGDSQKAAGYYAKLAALATEASSDRPELTEARQFMAQK